jgi:ABC-type uncharacterized transport system permease subunit
MRFPAGIDELAKTIVAGVIGFAVGAVIIKLFGYDPIAAYHVLFNGAFGDLYSVSESLANATPLILTALTFAIGFRGGMFNIGAEGQLYVGALAAVAVSFFHLPSAVSFGLSLICAGGRPLEPAGGHFEGHQRRARSYFNHHAELDISVSWLLSDCRNPGRPPQS